MLRIFPIAIPFQFARQNMFLPAEGGEEHNLVAKLTGNAVKYAIRELLTSSLKTFYRINIVR